MDLIGHKKTSMNKSILSMLIILLLSCNFESEKDFVNINQEINSLSNYSEKNEYLEMILNLDQNIRKNNDAELALATFAHDEHYRKMDSIDKLNYKRIDAYLSKFEYPDIDSVSLNASLAPWIVIHHSNLEKRNKHFKVLNKAYNDSNLDVSKFDFYLGRTYQMEYGEYPKWEGPYKPEEKIEWLIKELGYE